MKMPVLEQQRGSTMSEQGISDGILQTQTVQKAGKHEDLALVWV